jgi:hypothetical protein
MRKVSKESISKITGLQVRLDVASRLLCRWIDTMWLESPSHSDDITKMMNDTKSFLKEEAGDG